MVASQLPVAALASSVTADVVDIDRLVVAPSSARRGHGWYLVTEVLPEAAAKGRDTVVSAVPGLCVASYR